jgi:hypothetical protein
MRLRPLLLPALLLCACGLAQAQPHGLRHYRDSCSRDRVELMFELSAAVESGDVNRVAGLYDWAGMDTDASRGVMDRLEAMVKRTLVDVEPVYPPDPLAFDDDAWLAPPAPLPDPVALRVEQTLADGATPASTTLRMRRRMGCWWVVF